MKDILIPGEGWKLVGEGYKFTEGPTVNAKGEVFFNDVGAGKTYKVGSDGKPAVFLADSKRGDGQRFGPDGRLYANAAGTSQLLAWDADKLHLFEAESGRRRDDLAAAVARAS